MVTGPISLILSMLVIVFLIIIIICFASIPTIEKQRVEARRIFNLRKFEGKEKTELKLSEYFKNVKKKQWLLAIIFFIFLIVFIGAKFFIHKTIVLPPESFIFPLALVFVFVGFGLLMIVSMFRATSELIRKEYEFLIDNFW